MQAKPVCEDVSEPAIRGVLQAILYLTYLHVTGRKVRGVIFIF